MPEDEEVILPNKTKYEKISEDLGSAKECPYADRRNPTCDRYKNTKYMLGYKEQELNNEVVEKIRERTDSNPDLDMQGPCHLRWYINMCPEAASDIFYKLYISDVTFLKDANLEKSIYYKFDSNELRWPDKPEDNPKYQEYIEWLKNVYEWSPMHYRACPEYKNFRSSDTESSHPNSDLTRNANKRFTYSLNYRICHLDDEKYELSEPQADVVRILHEAKVYELHQKEILHNKLNLTMSRYRLNQRFRKLNPESGKLEYIEAWGSLIIPGSKRGFYKLNI